jgi:hypothetical protein
MVSRQCDFSVQELYSLHTSTRYSRVKRPVLPVLLIDGVIDLVIVLYIHTSLAKMADSVQDVLDRMVAPLRDLQDRGIFTQEEIHQIVDRRRQSEYALLRTTGVSSAEYLSYIQAEMSLEKLRRLRVKRILRTERRSKEQPATKTIGDQHIVQLIHILWERAIKRYRDISLILEYAHFCKKMRSSRKLGQLYTLAVQYFPKEAGLWIEAADHEYFGEGNVATARVLLQRGLRTNPHSTELWLQTFVLELHFVQKLHGRSLILLGGKSAANKGTKSTDSKKDLYKAAMITYNNAIQKIPDNVTMRLQFLDQSRRFPQTQKLQQHILKTIEQDCQDKPESWIARAMHATKKKVQSNKPIPVSSQKELDENSESENEPSIDQTDVEDAKTGSDDEEPKSKRQKTIEEEDDGANEVVLLLRQATAKLPTKDMYLQTIRFLNQYMEQSVPEIARSSVCRFVDDLFVNGLNNNIAICELAEMRFDLMLQSGENDAANEFMNDLLLNKKIDASTRLWVRWAAANKDKSNDILTQASTVLSFDRKDYMELLLEHLGSCIQDGSGNDSLFEKIILMAPMNLTYWIDDPMFGICSVADACLKYFDFVYDARGIDGARFVYTLLLLRSGVGGAMAKVENDALKRLCEKSLIAESRIDDKNDRKARILKLFDLANRYSPDIETKDHFKQALEEFVVRG